MRIGQPVGKRGKSSAGGVNKGNRKRLNSQKQPKKVATSSPLAKVVDHVEDDGGVDVAIVGGGGWIGKPKSPNNVGQSIQSSKSSQSAQQLNPFGVRCAPWKFVEHGPNIHELEVDLQSRSGEFRILLVSDMHWDNPHCDRKLLAKHLGQAVACGAPILSVGDLYCAMQGKYDRRSDKSCVLPEHQHGDYLDRLVNTGVDWFTQYSKSLVLLGIGNHCTSITDRHETNLLDRLSAGLRSRGGITRSGGYAGWLRLRFTRNGRSANSIRLFYHHGFGGGGPVTMGKIDFNRYNQYVDADVIVAGHVHYKEVFPVVQAQLTDQNTVRHRTKYMIRCGTYKDEFGTGAGGYHVEKGRGPRPMGGYWLRVKLVGDELAMQVDEAGAF